MWYCFKRIKSLLCSLENIHYIYWVISVTFPELCSINLHNYVNSFKSKLTL